MWSWVGKGNPTRWPKVSLNFSKQIFFNYLNLFRNQFFRIFRDMRQLSTVRGDPPSFTKSPIECQHPREDDPPVPHTGDLKGGGRVVQGAGGGILTGPNGLLSAPPPMMSWRAES